MGIQACQAISSGPDLVVWWRKWPESFALWSYNAVTNLYTEFVPGLAAGRASVVAGPTTVFSIQGTPCLRGGADGSLQAASLCEHGGASGNSQPQLQFLIDGRSVGTVSVTQLRVKSITEGAPSPGNVFQIYANGALAATISASGLVANEVEEAVL
jgi:hypothetical protein